MFIIGSFGAAASALGTDPSTVSKAIGRLEEQLEYQLFYRSTRKLRITPAGKGYLETVRKVLVELDTCEKQLATGNERVAGELKLNLPVSYGRFYVLPLLPEFCRRYPDIELNVTFTDEYVDIIEQGVDISIRTGTVTDSRLVVQQLSPMDFLICASPEYLQQAAPISAVKHLGEHPWIRFRFKQTGRLMPLLLGEGAGENADQAFSLSDSRNSQFVVDDGQAMRDLCTGGLGLTQAPHFLLRPELQSGELVSLFPCINPPGFGVYLLYPKRRFLPKKVAAFIDFLKTSLANIDETTHHNWAREIKPLNQWVPD